MKIDEGGINKVVEYLNSDKVTDEKLKKKWAEVKEKIKRMEQIIKETENG